MYFSEVLVGSAHYHGQTSLTYSSEEALIAGQLVRVSLRHEKVYAVVKKQVQEPWFKTKQIDEIVLLPPLPPQAIFLLDWMQHYYPAPLGMIAQLFLPKSLSKAHLSNSGTSPLHATPSLPPLTTEQRLALQAVQEKGLHLLHGETGSGKTRVYIELAKKALAKNRSAIILTPEIGLTSQLADNFREVFQDQIIVIHSQLTESARNKAWVQILQSERPLIIIGPRSALFAPLKNVGLIVVDEAHEGAYKQEQAPHYIASRVAAKLGQLHNCPVVLGSATPLVTDYFFTEQKHRPIIRMQEVATKEQDHLINVQVADLRDRTQYNRHPYLSNTLLGAMGEALSRNEQILLFLNRRGTARVIFCEQCGWQAVCPHCDLPLVYHGDDHTMRCHTCSFKQTAIMSCPECNNSSILFKSVGTKAIAESVAKSSLLSYN